MPLAHAFSHADHQVCFATHESERAFLAGAGLPYVIVSPGLDMTDMMRLDAMGQVQSGDVESGVHSPSEAVLDENDTAGVVAGKLSVFGYVISGYLNDDEFTRNLTEFAREWRADVVVWDSLSYGGSVAAAAAGALSVRSLFAIDQFMILRERYIGLGGRGDPLSSWLRNQVIQLGGECGRDEVDLARLVYGDVTLNPLPDHVQPASHHERLDLTYPGFYGGEVLRGDGARRGAGDRPRVCVTVGVSSRRFDLQLPPLGPLLDALADLPVDVVVTIGAEQARGAGLFREGFTYVEGAPLECLLPDIDLIIHHFGTGTLLSAYRHAVPQLHLEAPTDYWGERQLSERLHDTGHVWTIGFDEASTELIRETVRAILADPSVRERAETSRDVYHSRQSLSETVEQIAGLAACRSGADEPVSARRPMATATLTEGSL